MHTGTDFIRPEFLNILFFQQKNLVIYPYVDLKHLHYLEIFTAGYTVVDLESTALHNLKEILEFEATNSYSQNKTLFFIVNVDRQKVKEIMELDGIHCIININSNEGIPELVNGSSFIFFNKKSNQFLNYHTLDNELGFERSLISSSSNKEILQDEIQKIKITTTRIFTALNQDEGLSSLPEILRDYDQKYWPCILERTGAYFDINIPDINQFLSKTSHQSQLSSADNIENNTQDFSHEYETILSSHKTIGKEFIQLIHQYREKRVNAAHLELEELFNPQKLYSYLRNHHWKDGIPSTFIQEWAQMEISQYKLNGTEQVEFNKLLDSLNIMIDPFEHSPKTSKRQVMKRELTSKKEIIKDQVVSIPSVKDEWSIFKKWLENKLDILESLIDKLNLDNNPNKPKPKTVFIDTTNILNEDRDINGQLKVENILKLSTKLHAKGFSFVHIIDASTRHHIDDIKLLDKLISANKIILAPHGKKADEFVLKCAKKFKGKILSNDAYREYWRHYDQEWIYNNKLTCKYIQGEFIMV